MDRPTPPPSLLSRAATPAALLVALAVFPLPLLEVEIGRWVYPSVFGGASGRTRVADQVVPVSGVRLIVGPHAIHRTGSDQGLPAVSWSARTAAASPVLLVIGAALGLGLRPGLVRTVAVGVCAVLALFFTFGLATTQTFSGYVDFRLTPWGWVHLGALLVALLALGVEWLLFRRAARRSAASGG